ncbi:MULTISPECIES: 5'-deoxynucleotidase [Olsenella]|uniref:5'-deoxynucleotidase n=1 Tax=Olsenella TaxID=133925 RepID=UPI000231F3C4|nr:MULTISPECIES: 5'-deoxynucleotidase [Olsenella]EHF02340.1 hypothetical protein HMPREF1008_00745 [Olsenella sp. oral taxon 809 str. F0356]
MSQFTAIMARLKYIERWALMRSSRPENLSEHSLEVAMIAHLLCVIANVRYGRSLDEGRAALMGMYHDASEIITGDLPTPVKYFNPQIRDAYKGVESAAEETLLSTLPADLQGSFRSAFGLAGEGEPDAVEREGEAHLRQLVKAADKLSALIKCLEERSAGNSEFVTAEASTRASLERMAEGLPELRDFMDEFLPSYGHTLDQLL